MKKSKIFIVVIMSLFLAGCASDVHDKTSERCDSEDKSGIVAVLADLAAMCLDCQNEDYILSLKIMEKANLADYDFRYLGSLQVGGKSFKVIEKHILSGAEIDALRANVTIMLYLNGKLYGEYTGLNNHYSVSVSSPKLVVYNHETKKTTQFDMSDSIHSRLFIPYSDSIPKGDMLYLNRAY